MLKLKDKERIQIVNALRAGVVPTNGLKHIQVGRVQEINEILKDLDHITQSGSTIRFVSGEFGAGKSFFLTLCKLMAFEKKLVVMNADITTEKILCSSDGKTRALFTELIKNISYKSKSEGGGLKSIVETWIANFLTTNSDPTENSFHQALESMSHLTLCHDFASILFIYLKAYRADDVSKMEQCLKWLRAEYENKTEAKKDLGVSRIIDDGDFYDVLKLYGGFCRLAGFSGLLVAIDEIAVLVRQRAPQRNKNYETLLMIINDCLQGNVQNIGFIFGATSESIENRQKGLYSYGALETRLAKNQLINEKIKDLTGPVLNLATLSKEEIFVLLTKIRDIHTNFDTTRNLLPDEGIKSFFTQVYSRMGATTHLNPRDVIKEYMGLLSVLDNNPGTSWLDLIKKVEIQQSEDKSSLVKLGEDQ